jgi:hypothetical protein
MTALAITFLVVPPTFPVTSDKARLKTALEAPVKSAYQLEKGLRHAISNQLGSLVVTPGHHCEPDNGDNSHSGHEVCSDIEVICLCCYPD